MYTKALLKQYVFGVRRFHPRIRLRTGTYCTALKHRLVIRHFLLLLITFKTYSYRKLKLLSLNLFLLLRNSSRIAPFWSFRILCCNPLLELQIRTYFDFLSFFGFIRFEEMSSLKFLTSVLSCDTFCL